MFQIIIYYNSIYIILNTNLYSSSSYSEQLSGGIPSYIPHYYYSLPVQRISISYINRFIIVNLNEYYSLIFFILRNRIYTIYLYTLISLSASKTFNILIPRIRTIVAWFYLPLANKKIISLGLRF
ncbi:unnamed protein product [Clonostachys chloroleuca]|uniref:Uncharacterized protein n=1 Tax=Clonostachys chloroleuca TaxID=1926264 RepID=A0AA35PWY5_9HYPO|nr:unnamed protein product [Clonostachys chloroleuca]